MDNKFLEFLTLVEEEANPYAFSCLLNNKEFKAGGWDMLKNCIKELNFCTSETRSNAILFIGSHTFLFKSKKMMSEVVLILTDIINKNKYGEIEDAAMCVLYALREKTPEGIDGNLMLDEHVYNRLKKSINKEKIIMEQLDDLLEKAII